MHENEGVGEGEANKVYYTVTTFSYVFIVFFFVCLFVCFFISLL